MLSVVGPPIHPGFYEPNLELIIRKDARKQEVGTDHWKELRLPRT
jgi:hypothetical protein